MGLWTSIRDAGESALASVSPIDIRGDSAKKKTKGLTGAMNKFRNSEEGVINRITGRPDSAMKRSQAEMVNQQIKAYKDQTAITEKQLAEAKTQRDITKRQINEKQIRSLRNNYRPAGGLMNNQNDLNTNTGVTNKLGG